MKVTTRLTEALKLTPQQEKVYGWLKAKWHRKLAEFSAGARIVDRRKG